MDEQQIIGDILDKLYGYDSALREEDSEIIKAKKKEKDEKTKELKTQINNICKDLENELKAVLGPDVSGIKKIIRLQVLTSIKAEIDNGNNVVDSNGKISIGKTFDIIRQSKSEILEKIQDENETVNYKNEDGEVILEEAKEDLELKNLFEQLEDFGVDLTQDEKDLITEANAKVNEIIAIVEERIASGMSEDEAWDSIFKGKTEEEIETLKNYFVLVGMTEHLKRKEVEQEKSDSSVEGNDSGIDEKIEPSADKKESTSGVVSRKCEQSVLKNVTKAYKKAKTHQQEYSQIVKDKNIPTLNGSIKANVDSLTIKLYMNERITSGIDSSTLAVLQELQGFNIEMNNNEEFYNSSTHFSTTERSLVGNDVTAIHEMSHVTVTPKADNEGDVRKEKYARIIGGSKITDKKLTPFFEAKSEPFTFYGLENHPHTDFSMVGNFLGRNDQPEMRDSDTGIIGDEPVLGTTTLAPTSTTPQSPAPTSIVEEITVDKSGVTQEDQSQPSKKVTLSASTMKALVESQAEVRKMLEASGIIHGQTPERPTTGKTETQVAPVADSDEKSGGEPDEH